jgi:acyl carrier protein
MDEIDHKENAVTDVKESIRAFILEYAASRGTTELKDDEPILTSNIIDSLGSFEMILFLEKTFPLRIEDADMDPDNFQTLNHVERFVLGKLAKTEAKTEHNVGVPLARGRSEWRHRG